MLLAAEARMSAAAALASVKAVEIAVFLADCVRQVLAGVRATGRVMGYLDAEVIEERLGLRAGLGLAHFFSEVKYCLGRVQRDDSAAPAHLNKVIFELRK